MKNFVPKDFEILDEVKFPDFTFKKILASDVYMDYVTFMSNIEIIRKTRGGNWPTPDFTLEENLRELGWHQVEFEGRKSFAYTVFTPDEKKRLGCVYIYDPGNPWIDSPEGTDAIVNWWVTQEAYNQGYYLKLYKEIKEWMKKWPFKNIFYSNKEIPE